MVLVNEHLPPSCVENLHKLGYTPIRLPSDPRLAQPVASHPDMLLFIGKNILITDRQYYEKHAKKLLDTVCTQGGLSLHLTDEPPRPDYPHDIRFNAAQVGQYLFCYPPHTSPAVLSYAAQENLTVIAVRQGYARCALCPVGEHALITADPSIYRAACKQNDLDVLLIRQGHVTLPSYPYGFLGGCCGADRNHLYFCGDLDQHPDGDAIRTFTQTHGITSISLCDEPLFDGGSLLFVPVQNEA